MTDVELLTAITAQIDSLALYHIAFVDGISFLSGLLASLAFAGGFKA